MKTLPKLLRIAAVAALVVTLAACGSGNTSSDSESNGSDSQAASDTSTSSRLTEEESAAHTRAFSGEGLVNTFVGEKFCDDKVTNEEEAEACVMNALDRIGGDETTELELNNIRPNEDGMTVVTFTQRAGEMMVYGSTVKLVLDKDDNPVALCSSILPDVQGRDIEEWAVDAAGAEKVVMDQLKAQETADTLVEGATQRAILPMPNLPDRYICGWVVYTFDPENDDSQAYTAHYVKADGGYLYSLPVSGVDDTDAVAGESAKASFDFDAYEAAEMNVSLQTDDDTAEEVSVPVLKDPATGKTYLADAERKILCADYAAYTYDQKLMPLEVQDGVDTVDASSYYTFSRIWDYYDSIGWTGPDGYGTPALVLVNFVDAEGNPVDNAYYRSKQDGFQVFAFTREPNYGKCLDIVAHEFSHCVTNSAMTNQIYQNDPGAISEGFSDILGNIIEMRLDGDAGAWQLGEGLGDPIRSMDNPHEHAQPEFAFDAYYAPRPPIATSLNDRGGVHTNASLIAIVSYKLDQAGMTPKDQSYFWLNSALTMSPQSDYPMLAEILPWVMEHLGYSQYVEPLKAAIEEAKFTVTEDPGTVVEGCGSVTFDFADIKEMSDSGLVCLDFYRMPDAKEDMRAGTWPVAGTTIAKANLLAGDYCAVIIVGEVGGGLDNIEKRMVLGENGWVAIDDDEKAADAVKAVGKTLTVEAGTTLEVPTDGFNEVANEQVKEIVRRVEERNAQSAA